MAGFGCSGWRGGPDRDLVRRALLASVVGERCWRAAGCSGWPMGGWAVWNFDLLDCRSLLHIHDIARESGQAASSSGGF